MSDHTPTTEQVRKAYAHTYAPQQFFGPTADADRAGHGDEFDRWLAAHDAEVRARACRQTCIDTHVMTRRDDVTLHALPVGTVISADGTAYVHTDAWEWVETVTGTASTADELAVRHPHWHTIHTPQEN